MKEPSDSIPQVLAIASHVTYGYVGNKMVTLVMQTLGVDVSAIHTVHFSNHTAYNQFKGSRVTAKEIRELYEGLQLSNLNQFDMMLSGYIASADAVHCVGDIAKDLRIKASGSPGSFFWALDPVMGDEGRLYVAEEVVPAYRSLLKDADLILPNSFEAEVLSDVKITDMKSLVEAITKLHQTYQIPHIVVTSLHISPRSGRMKSLKDCDSLVVVGSSCRSDFTPRLFSVTVPSIPIFFSGTGDMLAALTLVRLREAVENFSTELLYSRSWMPPDEVTPTSLPLAKATEKALASMHAVLSRTAEARDDELQEETIVDGGSEADEKAMHLRRTRASEIRVIQGMDDLRWPKLEYNLDGQTIEFRAEAVDESGDG